MLSHKDFDFKSIVFIFSDSDIMRFANENLILEDKKTGQIRNQMPCIKIFCVFVIGTMTITSYLLEKASRYGFGLVLMRQNFKPYAFLTMNTEGNTLLRQKQYQSTENTALSRYIVKNKITNQLENLKQIRGKSDQQQHAIARLTEILDTVGSEPESNEQLLGKEGNASKIYFKAYFEDCNWQGRKPRVKIDPINTIMDIGYTFLFNFIEAQLRLYGFDLYMGFYHRLFYQRKSLVCDLVEPFRCIIDKSILKRLHLGQFKESDFEKNTLGYYLKIQKSKEYTRILFQDLLEYKKSIFFFVRDFYRGYVRSKPITDYPQFIITDGAG